MKNLCSKNISGKRVASVSLFFVLLASIFFISCGDNVNKYSELISSSDNDKAVETYNNKVRNNPLFMDYLNLVIANGDDLVAKLETAGCDKEILKAIKANKERVIALLHLGIIVGLAQQDVKDNEFFLVTGYIKSPKEMDYDKRQVKTMMMRNMVSYNMWEIYQDPVKLKDIIVDNMFNCNDKK